MSNIVSRAESAADLISLGTQTTEPGMMSEFLDVAERFGVNPEEVTAYLQPGEQLTGFGAGGSESLVIFVASPIYGDLVRKVCSEALSSAPWDPNGTGVMAPPSTKGGMQVDYLNGLPKAVRPYFPSVYNAETRTETAADGTAVRRLVYDQTLLAGTELSTFVAEAQPTPRIVAHLHREVMALLAEKVHPHREQLNTSESIETSYLDKIVARLDLSRSAAPETFGPLLDSDRLVINDTSYRNIAELLTFFRQPHVLEMLEPKYHSLVMGDSNTENVMITNTDALLTAMTESGRPEFTYDDIGLRFLDPRAIGHNSWGGSTVDDRMYDNKPIHNTVGNYDVIHGEYFSLAISKIADTPHIDLRANSSNPYTAPYANMANSGYFKYVMDGWKVDGQEYRQDDPNWLLRFTFMMGTHFAAMPPFHFKKGPEGNVPEDPEMQKRAIAIYCEGIKWLNRAHDMITGDRTSLYGVQLEPIVPSNRQ